MHILLFIKKQDSEDDCFIHYFFSTSDFAHTNHLIIFLQFEYKTHALSYLIDAIKITYNDT